MPTEPIIPAGTKLYSLTDGRYLVTIVKDLRLGDPMRDDQFGMWAIPKPSIGGIIPADLYGALQAMNDAFSAKVRQWVDECDTASSIG